MTALTQGRNTPEALGAQRVGGVAAATTIYIGAIAMRNAAGYLTKGQTATGLVGVGRAEETVINSGAAGERTLTYKPGTFKFANSAAGDLITIADIGKPAYAVDDQTVAKTSGTNTRSIAGLVDAIDADGGVWVRFDEALIQAYLT